MKGRGILCYVTLSLLVVNDRLAIGAKVTLRALFVDCSNTRRVCREKSLEAGLQMG